MRLVTYRSEGEPSCGMVRDGRVHATATLAACGLLFDGSNPRWNSVRGVLMLGQAAWDALGSIEDDALPNRGVPIEDLDVMAPVVDPQKIVCLGLNYRDHAEEVGAPLPEVPIIFGKFANSLAGSGDPIILPSVSDSVDFEGELAVVIGKRAKDVSVAAALDAVAGVMPLNDVSARDLQFRTGQWMLGKAIDTFAPCGPELVFLDEVDDLQALRLITRVNGETLQDGNTANMIFSVAETIAFLSRLMTLEAGDIIATGTPAGVGMGRNPPVSLSDGDVVDIELSGLATLSNPVRAGATHPDQESRVSVRS